MANLSDFLKIVNGATTAELHEFNKIVEQRLAISFRLRDKVQFDAGYRGIIKGKIIKVNRKTIGVLAASGMKWKVHPTLLTKI